MLSKQTKLYYYDIYPKVLPIQKEVEITIKALSEHVNFDKSDEYTIKFVGVNDGIKSEGIQGITTVSSDKKSLTTKVTLPIEQEYHVRLYKKEDKFPYEVLNVYALEKDLIEKRPLIGDFHVHSYMSDGREAPEYVCARYREEGFDFMAITDHFRYTPSVRAIDTYKDLDLSFKIYRGEEVHSPNNDVHIVNFGSDYSVNEICTVDNEHANWDKRIPTEHWLEEVKAIEDTLTDLPYNIDSFELASCILVCKKIREANGMSIFAHPHWRCSIRNISDAFSKKFLSEGYADAFELIGGQTNEENMTQIALYNELRANGVKIPIVGSSDSHGTVNPCGGSKPNMYEMFTEERTIVFAKENSHDDIISAVKNLESVAVQQYVGENYNIHGPYRLVQYALFLYENYFPMHFELCKYEGKLMRDFIADVDNAKEKLLSCKHDVDKLYQKYFYNK